MIPAGHGRYLFRCSGSPFHGEDYTVRYRANPHYGVPCAPSWRTLPEEWVRYNPARHYGFFRPVDQLSRCECGAYLRLIHRLEVSESRATKAHTCENTCQWSEAKKCRCACGGAAHGIQLREVF